MWPWQARAPQAHVLPAVLVVQQRVCGAAGALPAAGGAGGHVRARGQGRVEQRVAGARRMRAQRRCPGRSAVRNPVVGFKGFNLTPMRLQECHR